MNAHRIAQELKTLSKFLRNPRKWKLSAKDVAAEIDILAHQLEAGAGFSALFISLAWDAHADFVRHRERGDGLADWYQGRRSAFLFAAKQARREGL